MDEIAMLKFCLLCASITLMACAAEVGDSCGSDVECGAGLVCDQYSDGGYCTADDCEYSGCPDGARCVVFEDMNTFCMAACSSNEDCRDGYSCTENETTGSYCGQNDE